MAIYYLITSSLMSDLYTRYCDDKADDCTEDDDKFSVLPTFGFFIMVAWVSVADCISSACKIQNYSVNYTESRY